MTCCKLEDILLETDFTVGISVLTPYFITMASIGAKNFVTEWNFIIKVPVMDRFNYLSTDLEMRKMKDIKVRLQVRYFERNIYPVRLSQGTPTILQGHWTGTGKAG